MKKNKNTDATSRVLHSGTNTDVKSSTNDGSQHKEQDLDDDETGFGGWLKSPDGLDTMKLFVIANSIVLVTTLGLPYFQTALEILYEALYGPNSLY